MHVSLKRGDQELKAAWTFATWADAGLLQGWVDCLGPDSSGAARDSVDFARQTVDRWRGYADKRLTVNSLEEAEQRGPATQEFVALLVLKADWWLVPEHPLAFACFRKTWCGGLYLEFMAGHPFTEGRIKGILRATMLCLVRLAERARGEWIWWEATEHSFPKYERIVGQANALLGTTPRVKDVFLVRTPSLKDLLAQADRAI